jgi:hypothetical protein
LQTPRKRDSISSHFKIIERASAQNVTSPDPPAIVARKRTEARINKKIKNLARKFA